MANSPLDNATGVIKCTVASEGNQVGDSFKLMSIVVERAINKIASATIVFADGDIPKQKMPSSDADEFAPGKSITINAGYGSDTEQIFEGIVIRHGVQISNHGMEFIVECKDAAVAMTVGRKNANYVDQKNSDIITTILGNYSGLQSDIDATQTQFSELVQFNVTDWDFVVARAESSGLLVYVEDGKVSVKKPDGSASPLLTVTLGKDLMEFDAEIDARNSLKKVNSVAWDISNMTSQEQSASPVTINEQGNISASDLSEVIGLDAFKLQASIPMDAGALTEWATSAQQKASLSSITGRMVFQGNASVALGGAIEVNGVGDRFNGNVFISGYRHDIRDGNWQTEVKFGLSAANFTSEHAIQSPAAAGLTAAVEGLMTGIVKQLDQDPDGQFRVQVSLPVHQAETDGVWARLIQYYASNGFGNFFIPEIGDEVVLGFFNNDPSNPVILGSLYSSTHAPAYELTSDNFIKALVTKSGHTVEFDDDKKIITIKTPSENQLIFSDDDKSITLKDQNGNSTVLNSDGITLDSPKNIKLTATGTITLDATGEIDISSQADVSVKGMNIDNSANAAFSAKGNASAELSASGQTTVKGAMVMIN